ncbi:MlaD family protein [Salaquimonas pukyongi]|uniref:MlaD family protein n=1 Tax=Salaquimonas pukyongi TaxID=2712698 RepID=UPI00096BB52B|nr:MlaD family protein [Salaquimonas pukyongi]
METRANFVAVGFFTMAVILASFGFIYWVAQLDEDVAQRPITISIRGVVTGLAPGSAVHFNGIKVGKVTRVVFNPDDPREVLALAQVNEDTPVRADTTATIAAQGLTGVSIVSLKGGTPTAKSLFDIAEPGQIPRITARPSAVADILETVRDVSSKANDALGTLKAFIEENRTPVSNAVKNLETFSEALGRNADGVDEFLESASGIGNSLADLGSKIDGTAKGLERIVAAVEPEKVKTTVDNVAAFSSDLRKGGERIESVVVSVEKVAKQLETISTKLSGTLDKADGVLASVEPETVKQAITDIRETASGARQVVADARTVTKTFTDRQQDIDKIITDARQMAERLNQSSTRVDGVLAKLDGFLGADGSGDVMKDVRLTLAEFRTVAKTMQTSINSITGGISRFTNSGLGDIQALITDARRSVNRIDRVVGQIERDPQRFLLGGGGGVRTYNGRPRR